LFVGELGDEQQERMHEASHGEKHLSP
jgi:hypothetical protein